MQIGDRIVVRTGGVIPLDGKVVSGEAMVNQASITGEPLAVRRTEGSYVYAGTVVEEGDCTICVEKSAGSGRYDRIIRMIEESENSSPQREDHASHLADQLVPYSLGATALVWLLTGEYDQSAGCFDGRFFVCAQAIHADRRALCDERGERSSSVR